MTEQPVEPSGEPDVLATLDFPLICDMVHGEVSCERPAAYIATIHACNKPEGSRTIVCGDFVRRLVETDYENVCCAGCKKPFSSLLDRAWDIQPLGLTS